MCEGSKFFEVDGQASPGIVPTEFLLQCILQVYTNCNVIEVILDTLMLKTCVYVKAQHRFRANVENTSDQFSPQPTAITGFPVLSVYVFLC